MKANPITLKKLFEALSDYFEVDKKHIEYLFHLNIGYPPGGEVIELVQQLSEIACKRGDVKVFSLIVQIPKKANVASIKDKIIKLLKTEPDGEHEDKEDNTVDLIYLFAADYKKPQALMKKIERSIKVKGLETHIIEGYPHDEACPHCGSLIEEEHGDSIDTETKPKETLN